MIQWVFQNKEVLLNRVEVQVNIPMDSFYKQDVEVYQEEWEVGSTLHDHT
jgi:hypothetical protein